MIKEIEEIKQNLKNDFYEEFLYYITPSSLDEKYMNCDPIKDMLISNLLDIKNEINDNK